MDVLLTIIGFLGLGALIIAVVVFASAAKRYVSGEDIREEMDAMQSDLSPYRHWQERTPQDRRKNPRSNVFPLVINGTVIPEDRREQGDRRRMA